jgi:hypothetical protein
MRFFRDNLQPEFEVLDTGSFCNKLSNAAIILFRIKEI